MSHYAPKTVGDLHDMKERRDFEVLVSKLTATQT